MFVEVVPGWVLAIEARDEVAREVVDTLGVAAAPGCYRPFIRQHFPQIPLR